MKQSLSLSIILLLFPVVVAAQTFQAFLINTTKFLSDIVIPFLLGIAFLFFVINVIRFFVLGASNETDREKARSLAIYGVFAFVLIVIFWGIVNMFASSIGLGGSGQTPPDYVVEQAFNNDTCEAGQTSVCYDSFGLTICYCE